MGIGIFDIIALPKINKYYRILRDKNGRHVSIPIDAESAKTRLCRLRTRPRSPAGKVQLNMRDGSNVLADNTYKPGDSIVLSLEPESRFKIIDHFPFAAGNMAMVIGGKHSGKVARIKDIVKVPGGVPNKIILIDEATGYNVRHHRNRTSTWSVQRHRQSQNGGMKSDVDA